MLIALAVLAVISFGIFLFFQKAIFGKSPSGERLERIQKSPNYMAGKFQNINPTVTLNGSFFSTMWNYYFKRSKDVRPHEKLPVVKTDLLDLELNKDILVWFGHSSYFIQTDSKRILVDPVFPCRKTLASLVNKPFKGTCIYNADDMPEIDYLIITHDHWDHLDYETVKEIKDRVKKVICGLGVGAHFEHWGFNKDQIIEMDWNEDMKLDNGFEVVCLPSRHFSGRKIFGNNTLWASFLLKTPTQKIYMGGDSGYDEFFAEIGNEYGPIDIAMLDNGQYDKDWNQIHMMPEEVVKAAKDLKAKKLLPVHNSKFSIANHSWDDPLNRVTKAGEGSGVIVITPKIGEEVNLKEASPSFSRWWEEVDED